jgi:hypothetical protein
MTLVGRGKVRSHLTLIKVKFVFCSRRVILTSLSHLTLLFVYSKIKIDAHSLEYPFIFLLAQYFSVRLLVKYTITIGGCKHERSLAHA